MTRRKYPSVTQLPPPGPGRIVYAVDPITNEHTISHVEPLPGHPRGPVNVPIDQVPAYKRLHNLETVEVIHGIGAGTIVMVRSLQE